MKFYKTNTRYITSTILTLITTLFFMSLTWISNLSEYLIQPLLPPCFLLSEAECEALEQRERIEILSTTLQPLLFITVAFMVILVNVFISRMKVEPLVKAKRIFVTSSVYFIVNIAWFLLFTISPFIINVLAVLSYASSGVLLFKKEISVSTRLLAAIWVIIFFILTPVILSMIMN